MLELVSEGETYVWSAKVSLLAKDAALNIEEEEGETDESGDSPSFEYETIVKNGVEVLVRRTEDEFQFLQTSLPRLKQTESAITLLRDETAISPLRTALSRFIFSEASEGSTRIFVVDPPRLEQGRQACKSLSSLKEYSKLPLIAKAFLLQEDYREEFNAIKDQYARIFPTVSDIRIGRIVDFDLNLLGEEFPPYLANSAFTLGVKEFGLEDWITTARLSSGMSRTLFHLFELALAPTGTVVLIDEIENSLGINCLPQVSDHFLERSRDLQFIITSHHPYIINDVPMERWRVVTRKGSVVTVHDAGSIRGLQTHSAQDRFTLLINLPEYQEGVQ